MTDRQPQDEARLRVAEVIGRLTVGGAERHFVSLCNALPDCAVSAFFVSAQCGEPSLRDELDPAIRQVDVPIRKRYLVSGIYRLAAELKAAHCDVVHTHMFWPTLYGCLAARLAGVPVVVTTEHGENRWKKGWHRWTERHVISRIANMRFCVSPSILQNRRDKDGVREEILQVVSNGTPVPVIDENRPIAETPFLGSVGRLVKQKNFCLFVDAVAALRAQGLPVRACIVGDGPERSAIAARIEQHGMHDVFQLPGFDTNTDRWYRQFDIYVNSSREEGQPISVLEAMAYSLPVVACNVGAISDMVKNESEGLIVPPCDVTAMTAAIQRLVSDHALAMDLGRRARQRIINEFSIEAVAAEYRRHYQILCSGVGSNTA